MLRGVVWQKVAHLHHLRRVEFLKEVCQTNPSAKTGARPDMVEL